MEKIKITIKKDASLEYSVQGVKGKGCKMLTDFIDKLSKVISSKLNSEYYEKPNDEKDTERN
jgi:hypothetical protein